MSQLDPITEEVIASEPSVEERIANATSRHADEKKRGETAARIERAGLQWQQEQDALVPPEILAEQDDNFLNDTWEVTGSAVEQATEQVVRSLADLTSFAEGVGPQFVIGESEFVDPESTSEGIPIPFTEWRMDIVSSTRFKALDLNKLIATGEGSFDLLADFDLPDVDRPDSGMGLMASGILQWGLVFAATRKATGARGRSGIYINSVIADAAAFDPHEARLADLLTTLGEGNPVFDNAVTQYLSADELDSNLEGRMKNAIEGLGIGLAFDTLFLGIKWMRRYRKTKNAKHERSVEAGKKLDEKVEAKPEDLAKKQTKVEEIDLPIEAKRSIPERTDNVFRQAQRQLKETLKSSPEKAKKIARALEDGDLSKAEDLLDFNANTVDWKELTEIMGEANGGDIIRRLINTVSEVYAVEMKAAANVSTIEEILAKGANTTVDQVRKLAADVTGANAISGRLAGARALKYSSAQRIKQLAADFKRDPSRANDLALMQQIEVHAALQAHVKGVGSEVARALRSMQELRLAGADEFLEFDNIIRDLGKGSDDTRRHIAQRLADLQDLNKLERVITRTTIGTARDVWIEVYINGLLSSLSTLMLNNISNTLKVVEGITERYFAAAIGRGRNGMRGLVGRTPKEVTTFREANAFLYGTFAGFGDAMRIPFKGIFESVKNRSFDAVSETDFGTVWRAFKDEKPVLDTRMRLDIDTRKTISKVDTSEMTIREAINKMDGSSIDWNAKAINSLGKIVRLPGRLIVTSDEFFKQIAYNQELYAQAYRAGDSAAVTKGVQGKKRLALIERAVRNAKDFPPENLRFSAMDFARYQTFQADLPKGIARDIEQVINRNPLLRFVVPFYRTPVNIIKQTVFERTPLPFLKGHKSEILQRIAKGGKQGDIALARMATGSIFIGTGITWAMNGKITGSGSSNAVMSNTEGMDKIPPYSIKIGDKWYQYNRLEPLGMLLGLSADLAEAIDDWDVEADESVMWEAMNVALVAVTTNITDKSWFKGVADLVTAMEDPKRYLRNYGTNLSTTMVTPFSALLRRINVENDDIAREAFTWMEAWKKNIPGLSDELPARRDILGEAVPTREYYGAAWFSPVAEGIETTDRVYKEMARLSYDYRRPGRDMFGIDHDLTAKQYEQIMQKRGEVTVSGRTLKEALNEFMDSGQYIDVLDDPGRETGVKNIISAYHGAAKAEFLQDNPEYRDQVIEAKRAAKNILFQQ